MNGTPQGGIVMSRRLGENSNFKEIEERVRKQEKSKNTRSLTWDKNEKNLFIDEFVRIRLREPFMTPNTILDLAQKVLPEDRRVRIELLKTLPWLESEVKANLRSVSNRLDRLTDENKNVEDERRQYYNAMKQAQRQLEDAKAKADRIEGIAEELQEDIESMKTDPQYLLKLVDRPTLLSTAMTMLLNDNKEIMDKLEKIEDMVPDRPKPAPAASTPTAPKEQYVKKTYIAVACLLPSQQTEINNHVGNRAKVKHIDGRVQKKNIPNCDRLFIFARKSSHSIQETAFSALGRERVQIFHGGISNLKNEIDKFLGDPNG
jgi:hypothetical protein